MKVGLLLLVLLLSSITTLSANEGKPSSYVLYYQPLHEFDSSQSQTYLEKLRHILSNSEALQLHAQLVDADGKVKCRKNSQGPCSQVLYGTKSCVPQKTKIGAYCLKKSRPLDADYFKEPLFNRIKWNRLSLRINIFCNFKDHQDCQALAKLHDQYMLDYRRMIHARQELRKELLRGQ